MITIKRKLQTNILHEHTSKISQQNNSHQIQQYIKKNKAHNQVRFIAEIQGWKSTNVITILKL